MDPFRLEPAYKELIWGGRRLISEYGKPPAFECLAESWELSAHPQGGSVIASGPLEGVRFDDFVRRYPEQWGAGGARLDFPIMAKLIDTADRLSIQVHPDDAYARAVEGEADKTEMWVILDCEPDAFLYLGFEKRTSKAEVRRHIADGTLPDILRKVPVKPGDVYYMVGPLGY